MSYAICEAALLTTIQTSTANFTAANTSQGDYRILGSGRTHYVVLQLGSFENQRINIRGDHRRTWNINMELWVPFQGEISTVASVIRTQRQNLIDTISQYTHLTSSGAVYDAFVTQADEPLVDAIPGGPTCWKQVIVCQVKEDTGFTLID